MVQTHAKATKVDLASKKQFSWNYIREKEAYQCSTIRLSYVYFGCEENKKRNLDYIGHVTPSSRQP